MKEPHASLGISAVNDPEIRKQVLALNQPADTKKVAATEEQTAANVENLLGNMIEK